MAYKAKRVFLKRAAGWPEIAPELGDLLVRAFNMAEQWSEEDLKTSMLGHTITGANDDPEAAASESTTPPRQQKGRGIGP